jgi:hypothetical protein
MPEGPAFFQAISQGTTVNWGGTREAYNRLYSSSHKIDAEPKIPRGGTDVIMSVHGVEQAEARSTQTS